MAVRHETRWQVLTVAEAEADARQALARFHALADALEPDIGRERYTAVDDAIVELDAAIRREILTKLVHLGVAAMNAGEVDVLDLLQSVAGAEADVLP